MKKSGKRLSVCLAILLSLPAPSFGQDVKQPNEKCKDTVQVQEDPENGHKVTPLARGCVAPFSGQLLNPKLASELTAEIDGIPDQIEAAVTATAAHWKNEMGFQLKLRDIDLDAEQQKHAITQKALEDATHWTRSPWFITLVTAVVLVGTMAGTAALFDAVNQPD